MTAPSGHRQIPVLISRVFLKILELREKAKERLGEGFDIREFHDVILRGGPLPLTVLEQMVDEYLQDKAKG